jgi:hypothetical protein
MPTPYTQPTVHQQWKAQSQPGDMPKPQAGPNSFIPGDYQGAHLKSQFQNQGVRSRKTLNFNQNASPYAYQANFSQNPTSYPPTGPGGGYQNPNHNFVTNKKMMASFIPNLTTVELGDVAFHKVGQQKDIVPINPGALRQYSVPAGYLSNNDTQGFALVKNDDLKASIMGSTFGDAGKKIDIGDEAADIFTSNMFEALIPTWKSRKDQDNGPIIPLAAFDIIEEEAEEDYDQGPAPLMDNSKKVESQFLGPKPPAPYPTHPTPLKNNNWCIQSFVPTPAQNPDPNTLRQSISFIGTALKFNATITRLKSARQTFKDQEFPPTFPSLWGFGESRNYNKSTWQNYVWLRPTDIFHGPYHIYDKKIDPNDILQGQLGDCYFLSAIAAIAEYQDRIKKLFLTRDINAQGVFCIALCINGVWEEVILDDLFPCEKQGNRVAFNHSRGNELWVMVLEKAWAKVHGGYLNINSGLTREALHDLTGAPCVTYFNDESTDEERWNIMYTADAQHFIMTAGTMDFTGDGRDVQEEKTGIVGSHAYSMLAAVELVQDGSNYRVCGHSENSGSKGVTRLVKLRNPWGKGEWKGEWSDKDPRWTTALKNELGHTQADDGVFFMPYPEFLKYFTDFQVCYYHDAYEYSSMRYQTAKNQHIFFSFEIQQPGEYYFS